MSQWDHNQIIYLDNAASTRTDPRVVEAMLPYYHANYGNPSAIHTLGKWANDAIEVSRQQVANLIGCKTNEIIFVSGGTEANNLAILGVAAASNSKGRHIVTSEIEHHSVLETCHHLERNGYRVTYIGVDPRGIVSPESVRDAIRPDTILVTVMAANNVIGTLQPVDDIGAICRERGVYFHTDAVQLAGHLPLNVEAEGIDLLSLSAHKFNGPKGIGALYAKREVELSPIIFGGGQEEGLRSGTENVPAIIGLGVAAEITNSEMAEESARTRRLSRKLIAGILSAVPGSRLNGHPELRLPNNVNISIEGVEGEYLVTELSKKGLCVSTGSACSSGSHEAPYVLLATGLERDLANCSLRFSLDRYTDEKDIRQTIIILEEIVNNIRCSLFQ